MEEQTSPILEQGRQESIREIVKENPGIEQNAFDFIKAVGKRFIEKQVARFPEICEIARVQNILEWKDYEKYGKKGKFTDSYGWSEDGTFKFDYQIPQELYMFMVNLVDPYFWDNERVWRKFMKRICDGEDALDSLMQAKMYYGPAFRPMETN
ncbi:hypothetical protein KW791_00475 [Candidatus Parcubacteria bacterium]|nr:hypothetical protein [Candidatus Parcubacteria bacterium]